MRMCVGIRMGKKRSPIGNIQLSLEKEGVHACIVQQEKAGKKNLQIVCPFGWFDCVRACSVSVCVLYCTVCRRHTQG